MTVLNVLNGRPAQRAFLAAVVLLLAAVGVRFSLKAQSGRSAA